MSNNPKDSGASAYTPIRTRANVGVSKIISGPTEDELKTDYSLSNSRHQPQYTKPQFKKRRDKHGNVKIIRVR